MRKLPAGTIFWVLLESGPNKSDRMLLNRRPSDMEAYFRWVQKMREEVERERGIPFIIASHSITRP